MPYCPHCGGEVEHAIEASSPIAEAVDREVEIARINAERDIKVAQIAAREDKDWNETRVEVAEVEAEAEVAAAEATAEVIGEVIAAEAGAGEEAEAGTEVPIVIADEPGAEAEETPAPPETEAKPAESKSGWWSAYK